MINPSAGKTASRISRTRRTRRLAKKGKLPVARTALLKGVSRKCGVRNAECGVVGREPPGSGAFSGRLPFTNSAFRLQFIPDSELRIPHSDRFAFGPPV